ncbi:Methyltransferase [Bacillus mycoides]|uniref:class I SAM-dependent methyltransferase n=1 Tax=Bacillus mycoides TaxID=1405 RepID=UPI0005C80BAE|nr:class I SAM-dependent methyltransferase [Bacillus mycoides]KIV72310.1 Methyltransferase [Bacillus mycoides]PFM51080.1 class I SAM-dependent methyltransferase [Bacillus cereus]
MQQQYDEISELYDIIIPEPDGIFDFYSGLVKPNDEVLDLGCGTGRLSFILAEKGANVTSVDISAGMIEKASKKLDEMPNIKDKIEFKVSSATDFKSERKFDFIFMSGGVFEYLLTSSKQKLALRNIKLLLKEDGIFVFDIITPPTILPYSKRVSDGGNTPIKGENFKNYKVKSWDVVKADHYKQIVETTCYFEVYDIADNFLSEKKFRFLAKYTLPSEMQYLLEIEGFNIKNFYGDYNKNPFGRNSEFMVYECRKQGENFNDIQCE